MTNKYREDKNRRGLSDLIAMLPRDMSGIELGSALGESAEMFCASGKFKGVVCVDLFRNEDAFDERMEPYRGMILKLKGRTDAMACRLADNAYDFIYVDATHTYEAVLQDLTLYVPKVSAGGWIGGHDWAAKYGTEQAVREYFGDVDVHHFCDSSWLLRKP